MGIPDFYPIFFGSGSNGRHPRPPGRYHRAMIDRMPPARSLALDANALIYLVLPFVFGNDDGSGAISEKVKEMTDKQLQEKVFEYLGQLILMLVAEVAPKYALIVAFDGVAPLAKINQQKQRRYASNSSPVDTVQPLENPEAISTRDKGFPRFNKDCISCGTQFMFALDEYMQEFLDKHKTQFCVRKIIYSSHLEHGEGEHKIFDFYRRGLVTDDRNPVYDGYHVIYGMDADLIMIASLSEFPDIILARDSIDISMKDLVGDIKPIQKYYGDTSPKNIDINEVRHLIVEDLGTDKSAAIADFVFIMTMLGNDFLPHPIAKKNTSDLVTKIIKAYTQINATLTLKHQDSYLINWSGLLVFLRELAREEPEILNIASSAATAYPSRFFNIAKSGGLFDYGRLRNAWYTNEAQLSHLESFVGEDPKYRDEWVESSKKSVAPSIGIYSSSSVPWMPTPPVVTGVRGSIVPMITNMCYQYIRGMCWTLQYYYFGMKAMTWTWAYPYHHAPLFTDMTDVLDQIIKGAGSQINNYFNVRRIQGEVEFEAPHVLLAILSPYSAYLVPKELQKWYISNIYYSQSPLEIAFETDGISNDDKLWKSVALVPKVDYPLIMALVKKSDWTTNRWMLWRPVEHVPFDLTEEEVVQYMERERQRKFLETTNEFSRLRRAEMKSQNPKPRANVRRGGSSNYVDRRTDSRSIMFSGAQKALNSSVVNTSPDVFNEQVALETILGSTFSPSSSSNTRARGGYNTRGRGRGEYVPREGSRGRGRGEYVPREGSRGRGRGDKGKEPSKEPSTAPVTDLPLW